MLDPQLLRTNPRWVAEKLATRGFHFDVDQFMELEALRKTLQTETQALQNERNQRAKAIGTAKGRGEDVSQLLQAVDASSQILEEKKQALAKILTQTETLLLGLPNIPHDSVPIGQEESDYREERRIGTPRLFNFEPRSHDDLGERLGWLDFSAAAKITGSRFVVMKHHISKLHRALAQWMLDVHTLEHGYQELNVPCIVNADSLLGTGQLPKFEADLFKLAGELPYYLVPTAEIPVTNMVRDVIIPEQVLPLRYSCHSPCFRSEAGSYGKDTKGMIRQHQFEKVELVWITTPDKSYEALEALTSHAESILQRLDLPYRVITLCTGDMNGGSAKTYDLEVWLPSQKTYREISSCSNMETYQARRMKARFRDTKTQEVQLVHTLNGSGLAIGRTLVAVMENYQDEVGNIHIPKALQPYMNGMTVIGNF